MNYTGKTKSDLIDIIKYRDKEIESFHSLYSKTDIDYRDLEERFQILVYLLILVFTVGVLF